MRSEKESMNAAALCFFGLFFAGVVMISILRRSRLENRRQRTTDLERHTRIPRRIACSNALSLERLVAVAEGSGEWLERSHQDS